MKLPLLDQLVPLHRGEAFVVAHAIGRYLAEAISRPDYAQKLYWQEALALTPLELLRRRLLRRHESESWQALRPGRAARPRLLRVPYAELVALREFQTSLQSIVGGEQLPAVLGKFHQKSLNLERFIKFSG
ncbi:hypothetical protein [uncultured Hymenobacter sp.]|uniref:hypothetical protein n=1 Tax=uncultured Hymenobacter sp. TaxID=170016 RepID=UPI0035C9D11D